MTSLISNITFEWFYYNICKTVIQCGKQIVFPQITGVIIIYIFDTFMIKIDLFSCGIFALGYKGSKKC